ncbi:MAG TPA: VWA domain-containing protein [Candidatus Angelobacter sp.]|nr:VWA domain-containing protein [Candidatus Angelobacter sp.]
MQLLPTLAVAALLPFAPIAAAAQEVPAQPGQESPAVNPPPAQTDAEKYKFTARSNLVFLPTRVQNKKNETIYGLKPEQFIVEDNGVPQTVRIEEDPESTGLSLVVAIQCSRSADKEFNKFKGLGAMIEEIVGEAPHEIAILSFGEAIYTLGDFSSNPDAVGFALSKVKACGDYSAITIDAVGYAISMLKRRQNHFRRAILLISEARDHGSRSRLHEVITELGISDTVIYTIAFSPAKDEFIRTFRYGSPNDKPPALSKPSPTPRPTPTEDSSSKPPEKEPVYLVHPPALVLPPSLMMAINALRRNSGAELASLSGGEYINFTTQKGFEEGLQRISNQIHNYYLLSFRPPSTPTFGLHSLRVRVPDYPDAVIQTRRSYWAGILESSPAEAPQPK